MRLLFISDLWYPFPGGAERYIFNVAREMAEREHEICVLSSYEKAQPGRAGFELIVDGLLGAHTTIAKATRSAQLSKHIAELRPEFIFIHRFFAEEYGKDIETSNIPFIEIVHQRRCTKSARLFIYNSDYTRIHNEVVNEKNMVILPPAYKDEVWSEHRGDKIGFVKPIHGKGIDLIYDLADGLPQYQFLGLRGEWQAIEDIRDKRNVSFVNPVECMYQFYQNCRLMLVPSVSEDAGTIPQEAAFAGIPCISSKIMGLLETNKAGVFPSHPYLECWMEEIKRFDHKIYYDEVVKRQLSYVESYDWESRFSRLNSLLKEAA